MQSQWLRTRQDVGDWRRIEKTIQPTQTRFVSRRSSRIACEYLWGHYGLRGCTSRIRRPSGADRKVGVICVLLETIMSDKKRIKTELQRQQLWIDTRLAAYNASEFKLPHRDSEADSAAEKAVNSFDEFFQFRVND